MHGGNLSQFTGTTMLQKLLWTKSPFTCFLKAPDIKKLPFQKPVTQVKLNVNLHKW